MLRTRKFSVMFVALLCLTLLSGFGATPVQAAGHPSDISGHWAQGQIENMIGQGVLAGYPDGTFKPDAPVTRAEFITMINRAFNFTTTTYISYSDVSGSDWFAPEIAKAQAAGYISGYADGTVKPNAQIERQEVAVIVAQVLKLDTSGPAELDRFADASTIPSWSRPAVGAMVRAGYLSGYPDGTFLAFSPTSRAMAAVILNKALDQNTTYYSVPRTFGPDTGTVTVEGNVIITAAGVIVQNTIITGNLIISASVGQEDIILKNVTVQGSTYIRGGDTTLDGSFHNVFMEEDHGLITIAADIDALQVSSPTAGAWLNFTNGHIGSVTINKGTRDTHVSIADGVLIDSFYSYALLDATGNGTVRVSYVYVSGITSTLHPESRIMAPGVSAPTDPTSGTSGTGSDSDNAPPRITFVAAENLTIVNEGNNTFTVSPVDANPIGLVTMQFNEAIRKDSPDDVVIRGYSGLNGVGLLAWQPGGKAVVKEILFNSFAGGPADQLSSTLSCDYDLACNGMGFYFAGFPEVLSMEVDVYDLSGNLLTITFNC